MDEKVVCKLQRSILEPHVPLEMSKLSPFLMTVFHPGL